MNFSFQQNLACNSLGPEATVITIWKTVVCKQSYFNKTKVPLVPSTTGGLGPSGLGAEGLERLNARYITITNAISITMA